MGSPMKTYPHSPGFKEGDTSRDAAVAVEKEALTVRERVLQLYQSGEGFTADEVAAELGLSILTVRPRVTELKALGYLTDSGERRTNQSGLKAKVMWIP